MNLMHTSSFNVVKKFTDNPRNLIFLSFQKDLKRYTKN